MNLNLKGNNYSSLPPDTPSTYRSSPVDGGPARDEIQIVVDRKETSAQQMVRPTLEMPQVQASQQHLPVEEIEVAMPPVQRTTPQERLDALDFDLIERAYARRNQLKELGEDVWNNKLVYLWLLCGAAAFGAGVGVAGRVALEQYRPTESSDRYDQDQIDAAKIGAFVAPPLLVLGVVGKATVSTLKSLWSLNGPKTQIQDGLRYLAGEPGCNPRFIEMFARLPQAYEAWSDPAFFQRTRDTVDMMKKHPDLAGKIFDMAQTMGSEYISDEKAKEFDKRAYQEVLKFKMRELPEGDERTEMAKYLYCCEVVIPAIAWNLGPGPNPSDQIFEALREKKMITFGGPIAPHHYGPLDDAALKIACTEVKNRLDAFMDPANATIRLPYESKLLESNAERNEREARVNVVRELAKDWCSVAIGNVYCRNRAEGEPADDPKTRLALELYVWETLPKEIANEVSRHIFDQRAKGLEGPDDVEIAADCLNEAMAKHGIRTWIDREDNFSVNDSANLPPNYTGRQDKPWAQVGGFATQNWHQSPQLPVHLKIIEARQRALAEQA